MDLMLHDRSRRPIGRARVDPAARPTRVRAVARDGSEHEAYLDWERALDDAGQLRACVACGCRRLYRRRTLPRVVPFALVLAAAGLVAALLGYSSHPAVMAVLVALLVLDGVALVAARTVLVCYRCGTVYRNAPVARFHGAWDAAVAAEPECQPDAPADADRGAGAADPPGAGPATARIPSEP